MCDLLKTTTNHIITYKCVVQTLPIHIVWGEREKEEDETANKREGSHSVCLRSTPSLQRWPQVVDTRNSANHTLMVPALICMYVCTYSNSYYIVHLCACTSNVSMCVLYCSSIHSWPLTPQCVVLGSLHPCPHSTTSI